MMHTITAQKFSQISEPLELSGQADRFARMLIERMDTTCETNGYERRGELSRGVGYGCVQTIELRKGLSLEIFNHYFHDDQSSHFTLTYPSLRFVFFLSGIGHLKVLSPFGRTATVVDQMMGGHCSVGFFPELEGGFRIRKESRHVQVTVNIAPALLRPMLLEPVDGLPREMHAIAEGADNLGYYHIAPMPQSILTTLNEILFCPYTGSVRKVFLESKALELVAHKLAQTQNLQAYKEGTPAVGSNAVEKIHFAEAFMVHNLEQPPGLVELASKVGMSPQRLNTGFRRVFGTTVFGHLRRLRLERARYLMEKQGQNVTEAALAVGYNSVPSFSQAFSRHFLVPPGKCGRPPA